MLVKIVSGDVDLDSDLFRNVGLFRSIILTNGQDGEAKCN